MPPSLPPKNAGQFATRCHLFAPLQCHPGPRGRLASVSRTSRVGPPITYMPFPAAVSMHQTATSHCVVVGTRMPLGEVPSINWTNWSIYQTSWNADRVLGESTTSNRIGWGWGKPSSIPCGGSCTTHDVAHQRHTQYCGPREAATCIPPLPVGSCHSGQFLT